MGCSSAVTARLPHGIVLAADAVEHLVALRPIQSFGMRASAAAVHKNSSVCIDWSRCLVERHKVLPAPWPSDCRI